MPFEWLFDAMGGGEKAALYVIVAFVSSLLYFNLIGQIKELKAANAELRASIHDLSTTIESWTPANQRRRLRRPVP